MSIGSLRALAQDVAAALEHWQGLDQARRLRPDDLLLARRTDEAHRAYVTARSALLGAARPA